MCDEYATSILYMCIAVSLLSIGALIYCAQVARVTALGDALLKACAGDYPSAYKAVNSVHDENELLGEAVARGLRRRNRMRSDGEL